MPKPKGIDQLEQRAQWVIDRWDERPSLRYGEMVAEIRQRYFIGKNGAEQVVKRAREILRDSFDPVKNPELTDRITAKYFAIVEGAEREGEWRAARAALDSLRRHLGLGAPDRVEQTTKYNPEDFEDMTDDQVRSLAQLDAKKATTTK